MEFTETQLRHALARHEIVSIDFHHDPIHDRGYWVPVAHCNCGHTSPPEHRAAHLTTVIAKERSGYRDPSTD